jgi:predicted dehydrogenase
LANNTISLLNSGTQHILVEKPGGFYEDIEKIVKLTTEKNAHVHIAYNRRYYAATLKAKEIIAEDGGVSSFHFEFTEWAHTIEPLQKAKGVKEQWLLANSTHVIDHAFYLGGTPQQMNSYVSGTLDWHPSASIFSGAGISQSGAPFSYHANWASPGRWSVEILTKKHRLIFKPMEKLQIQKIGSVVIEDVEVDYSKDHEFKPGLFLQVSSFLANKTTELPNIAEQHENLAFFKKINFGT